jgi:hypothetical protein
MVLLGTYDSLFLKGEQLVLHEDALVYDEWI